MTRRSELPVEDHREEWLRRYREGHKQNVGAEVERLHCRKPGIVQRITAWGVMHFALLASLSLVGWLIALALAALLVLPGCSDPGINAREDGAFQETENQLARYGDALANGTADAEHYKKFLHDTLANLKTAERGEREQSSGSWLDLLYSALGGGTVVGAVVNKLRSSSREKALAELADSLRKEFAEQLEQKGGSA